MQILNLNYYQRLTLWGMVGNHSAENFKEASVFIRIIEKVRPTDEESRDTQLVSNGPQMQWRLPSVGYGDKEIEFEDSEIEAIAKVVNTTSPIRVNDAEWLEGILNGTAKVTSK